MWTANCNFFALQWIPVGQIPRRRKQLELAIQAHWLIKNMDGTETSETIHAFRCTHAHVRTHSSQDVWPGCRGHRVVTPDCCPSLPGWRIPRRHISDDPRVRHLLASSDDDGNSPQVAIVVAKRKYNNTARILPQTVIYITGHLLELTSLKLKCWSFPGVRIKGNVLGQIAASKCESCPTFQGRSKFLKRRRIFTSWRGCVPENISLKP